MTEDNTESSESIFEAIPPPPPPSPHTRKKKTMTFKECNHQLLNVSSWALLLLTGFSGFRRLKPDTTDKDLSLFKAPVPEINPL